MSRTLKVELEVITDKASKSVAKSLTEGVRSALEGLRQISFESFFQDLKIKPVIEEEVRVTSSSSSKEDKIPLSDSNSQLQLNSSGASSAKEEEKVAKAVSKAAPTVVMAGLEGRLNKAIDKAWSAPKSNKGRYFLQDGAKPDTTIDEHILSEEKEMNKTLDEISSTLKNSRGAVW